MIQLFIPLTCLVSLLAYYFISYDLKFRKRVKGLEKLRKDNETDGANTQYYGWELNDLI